MFDCMAAACAAVATKPVTREPDRRQPHRIAREGDRRRDWLLRAIIDQLKITPLITQRELSQALGHDYNSVRAALAKMLARREVELVGRKFLMASKFCRLSWSLDVMTIARFEREAADRIEEAGEVDAGDEESS